MKVQVFRNHLLESEHQISALVTNETGEEIFQTGNIDQPIFPRSSIKFFQALILFENKLEQKYQLTPQELAIACSSHRGEKIHIEVVDAWLKKLNLSKSHFACGPHAPGNPEALKDLYWSQQNFSKIHNNCSGKHCGFLNWVQDQNLPLSGYEKYDHPLQKHLREKLSEVFKTNLNEKKWGIDGCGIPTYFLKMSELNQAWSQFLVTNPYSEALDKIHQAIKSFPDLVSGTDHLVSQIIKKTKGEILLKNGAEGVMSAVSFRTRKILTLKAQCGTARASESATVFLLKKHLGLTDEEHPTTTDLKNWSGHPVGQIVPGTQIN